MFNGAQPDINDMIAGNNILSVLTPCGLICLDYGPSKQRYIYITYLSRYHLLLY